MFVDTVICGGGGVKSGEIISNKLNGLLHGYEKTALQPFVRLLAL